MNPKDLKDWVELGALIVAWIFAAAVLWTRQNNKINGLGRRVKGVEDSCSGMGGRMSSLERDMVEHRRDVQEANRRLGSVEKAVENVGEVVRDGNTALGVQLHNIERLITETDKRNSNRLVRLETVTKIEQKVGPIPTGD